MWYWHSGQEPDVAEAGVPKDSVNQILVVRDLFLIQLSLN